MLDIEIRNLPKDEPVIFGKWIEQLAIRVLPDGEPGKSALLKMALFLTEERYAKTSLWYWVKGEFEKPHKRITPTDWYNIVRYFWRKPGGLTCREEVEALAHCGGPILAAAMQNSEKAARPKDRGRRESFERLFQTIGAEQSTDTGVPTIPLDPNYLAPIALLPRPEIENVVEFLQEMPGRRLVLFGMPGAGKTILLSQLLGEEFLTRLPVQLSSGALYLPFNQGWPISVLLNDLARQVGVDDIAAAQNDAHLLRMIKFKLGDLPWLLILDGVSEVDVTQELCGLMPSTSSVILTTSHWELARMLVNAPGEILELGGFTDDQAWQLYRKMRRNLTDENPAEKVQRLNRELHGNPASLTAAFRLANEYGLDETLRLVMHGINEPMMGLLGEVFKPNTFAYHRLRSDIYRLQLAALAKIDPSITSLHEETVAAFLDVDISVARYVLKQLMQETQLVQPVGDHVWDVKPLARPITRIVDASAVLEGGDERAMRTPYMTEEFEKLKSRAAKIRGWDAFRLYWAHRQMRGQSAWGNAWLLFKNPKDVPSAIWELAHITKYSDARRFISKHLTDLERGERKFLSTAMRIQVAMTAAGFFFTIVISILMIVVPGSEVLPILNLLGKLAYGVVLAFALVDTAQLIIQPYGPERVDIQRALLHQEDANDDRVSGGDETDMQWTLWRKNQVEEDDGAPEEETPHGVG